MSTIQTEIIRLHDRLCVKAVISIDLVRSEVYTIQFIHEGQVLDIFYTSDGSIYADKIHLKQKKSIIESVFEYKSGSNECIISCFTDQNLINHESLLFELENLPPIKETPIEIAKIQTSNADFSDRLSSVASKLADKTWRLIIEVANNIHVRVLKPGGSNAYLAFGESGVITQNDFIFPIYLGTSKVIIPKEIVWGRYNQYSINARLGCFLIAQTDFHKIKHLYHKVPVSNALPLSEFPKLDTDRKLENFRTPLGDYFDLHSWEIKNQLPVRH